MMKAVSTLAKLTSRLVRKLKKILKNSDRGLLLHLLETVSTRKIRLKKEVWLKLKMRLSAKSVWNQEQKTAIEKSIL